MKTKVIFIFVVSMATSLCLTLLQSCDPNLVSICGVEITGLYSNYNDKFVPEPDTLVYDIGFKITAHDDRLCHVTPAIGGISTCNAQFFAEGCLLWKNEIVRSSFQLRLNRPVVLGGDTLPAGTDLFQQPVFANGAKITEDYWCKGITYEIRFSSNLIRDLDFESGTYLVTFTCNTDDNKVLNDWRQVVFRL